MNYDVDIFRGEELESTHRVLLTNIDSKEGFNLYLRSSFKPFQLIPFVSSGGVEEFSLDESTLALFTSSHSGEKIHTDYLEEILINNNINENLLFCSPHWPLSNDRSRQLASLGQRPTRVHNNCSGKHVAMLLMCKLFGFSMNNYTSMTKNINHAKSSESLFEKTRKLIGQIDAFLSTDLYITKALDEISHVPYWDINESSGGS